MVSREIQSSMFAFGLPLSLSFNVVDFMWCYPSILPSGCLCHCHWMLVWNSSDAIHSSCSESASDSVSLISSSKCPEWYQITRHSFQVDNKFNLVSLFTGSRLILCQVIFLLWSLQLYLFWTLPWLFWGTSVLLRNLSFSHASPMLGGNNY